MIGGNRGASEVIGFVLVFSIVFAGAGLTYAAGTDVLTGVHDEARAERLDRSMTAVGRAVDAVGAGAPVRSVTLAPDADRLVADHGPAVTVTVDGADHTVEMGALSAHSGSWHLTAVGGAVIRSDGRDSTMRRRPTLSCRSSRGMAVIPVVTFAGSNTSTDVDRPVRIEVNRIERAVWQAERVAVSVNASAHRDAWMRYFERTDWNGSAATGYQCATDRVIVRLTTVRVRVVA